MQMLPHASLTERTPQLVGQGMQNETKAKNAAWELLDARSPLEAQSRGNVAKGNTRAKTCNHSANVTHSVCSALVMV